MDDFILALLIINGVFLGLTILATILTTLFIGGLAIIGVFPIFCFVISTVLIIREERKLHEKA